MYQVIVSQTIAIDKGHNNTFYVRYQMIPLKVSPKRTGGQREALKTTITQKGVAGGQPFAVCQGFYNFPKRSFEVIRSLGSGNVIFYASSELFYILGLVNSNGHFVGHVVV